MKTGAQSSTIVTAYYKRAQEEYAQHNYKQAIAFLKIAQVNAGTKTCPDITYLKAKAHYRHDINIVEAKQLFLKFLEEAPKIHSKFKEVLDVIRDIEISNKIDTFGYFKDPLNRNGTKKYYYNKEHLQKVETYKNGLLDGVFLEYFENGKLYREGHYEDGVMQGTFKSYSPSGIIKTITEYSSGVKHGIEKRYTTAGILAELYTYANNQKHGSFKTFHEDGKTIKEEGSYKGNQRVGIYKSYYENSSLAYSALYGSKGEKDGPEIKFYPNGTKEWVKNYLNGKLRGIQKYYYNTTQLSKWHVYNQNGLQDGENKEYHENGILAITILYENGRVIDVLEQQNSKGKNIRKSKLKKTPYGTGQIIKVYDNNTISYKAHYVDGLLDGDIKTYYKNGQLKCEGSYNYGSKHGEFKQYYITGVLKSKGAYKSNHAMGYKDGEHLKYYETGELLSKTVYQYNEEIEKTTYHKNGKKSAIYNYLNDVWDTYTE
ncbi:toxin-antitoxin system YwqK family antitoxin [Mariniflexile ostreae]|uniref:Toxin-antitoxin system YwqK family antitoxin n=1 Tax=Mariniflexile ostreae TaxID=1520892 RepID=A0ABV5FDK5_9FLAO